MNMLNAISSRAASSPVSGKDPALAPEGALASEEEKVELDRLYKSYGAQLVGRLSLQTGCRETARDLAQEVFTRFLGLPHWKRLRLKNPEAFLMRISINLLSDWARSQTVRRPAGDELQLHTDGQLDQVAFLEARDTLRRLESAMLRLKPKTREIFMAHRLDGLSYAEISERSGLSVKGVEKQMSKAIAKIDRLLDRP